MENYLEINRDSWDSRVEQHTKSNFYDLKGFIDGENPLNEIELELLGDVNNKTMLHLQCHFGMDSLALARLGAKVTGVDFSKMAIKKAIELSQTLNLPASFVCTDVYKVPEVINTTFDCVFTSYGTIGWLPDTEKWATVISKMLNPGGRFIMADFHPTLWMMNDMFNQIEHSYFNLKPIIESSSTSYAGGENLEEKQTIGWNHSMADILSSLIRNGLEITNFQEYDYSPYPCFKNLEKIGERRYQVKHLKKILPMVYSLVAQKK